MKAVKYGASWCAPCRLTTQILKDSKLEFEEVDIDENELVATERGITTIPVVDFYASGSDKPFYTHKGLLTKDILDNIIKEYGE